MIQIVNDPCRMMTRILWQFRSITKRLKFVLCLAGTRTSDVVGVSAAGKTAAHCRLTPAQDAEILFFEEHDSDMVIPLSPAGVVSPVIISKACAKLLDWSVSVIDCGVFRRPRVPVISLGDRVADCISTGAAQPRSHVELLFERGFALGEALAKDSQGLVLAECVPGGTTTALAVLTLLGYQVDGMVSSSVPNPNNQLRQELLKLGLSKWPGGLSSFRHDAIAAIAAMGDPMQAVVMGMAIAATKRVPVILAGGSQMLAVYALLKTHRADLFSKSAKPKVAVCTTKWVANDRSADTQRLAKLIEAPLAAAHINLARSQHNALRSYEDGYVKEGCGAGAALLLTALSGLYDESEIIRAIDAAYEQFIGTAYAL